MRNQKRRNVVLSLVGLAALTIYILACTASFSPDDTKVVYPAFDASSGRLGIAVYNRETARSETLFLPLDLGGGNTNDLKTPVLRPQWMADGRRVLVAWGTDSDLTLALVPCGARGPVKFFFRLFKEHSDAAWLMVPLPVVGERAFIRSDDKEILRLDLRTGEATTHKFTGEATEVSLWPAPGDKEMFYLEGHERGVFGRLNPETFERTPLFGFTNQFADGSFFAYDKSGKHIAFVEEAKDAPRVVVLEEGKAVFTRTLDTKGGKIGFGNAVFSPTGNALLGSYQLIAAGQTNSSFGLIEIPLNNAPVRMTPLVAGVNTTEETAALYFQIGVSHDGKTAAAASAYLACAAPDFKPEDCALFLVDLRDARHKVNKVPIPLPAIRPTPFK